MCSNDEVKLTAGEAAAAIRAGRLTAAALVEACLARIAARDGTIGAFVRLAPDAPDAAARADASPPLGPLHGVPIAVKDIIATAGLGTEYGSPIFRGHVPAADAACVARLKRAGAVILGKTVTTEFAHVTPQATVNPLDPGRTPGGSSSGSAAAVSDFMAPAALGTQTGGSVIRPASYCGLYGFKSSIGRTETAGVHELARSLDTVGWFSRSAADLALLGSVLLAPEARPDELPRRPRLARLRTPFDDAASPEMHTACDGFAARMAASGAEVTALALPPSFAGLNALHRRIVSAEASRAFARYAQEHSELLSPALAAFIAEGRANAAAHGEALATAAAARGELDRLLQGIDALILPATTGEAPLGLYSTGDATFSLFLSLLGPPCATIPGAQGPSGMPLGVQLVGRRGADEALLALVECTDEQSQKNVRTASTTL